MAASTPEAKQEVYRRVDLNLVPTSAAGWNNTRGWAALALLLCAALSSNSSASFSNAGAKRHFKSSRLLLKWRTSSGHASAPPWVLSFCTGIAEELQPDERALLDRVSMLMQRTQATLFLIYCHQNVNFSCLFHLSRTFLPLLEGFWRTACSVSGWGRRWWWYDWLLVLGIRWVFSFYLSPHTATKLGICSSW